MRWAPKRAATLVACSALVVGAAACSPSPRASSGTTRATTTTTTAATTAATTTATTAATTGAVPRSKVAAPCGWWRGKPQVRQILVIWEENHDYSSLIGSPAAPELNALASECGLATDYHALAAPSLPNYLEMTSALGYMSSPWTSDCDAGPQCQSTAPSVFSVLVSHHLQWRAYAEAMTANCGQSSYDSYAARHNPAVYYTSVRGQCARWDVPLGTLDRGPLHDALLSGPKVALTTVTPDLDNDMHNGTVAQGDHWLSQWLPLMVASPAYRTGHLAIIIVWDEGTGSPPSHVPMVVLSASTPRGARSSLPYNDFSIARAICEVTGVPLVGRAGSAPSPLAAFRL